MFLQRSTLNEGVGADVMCLRYSPEENFLCSGCYDGHVRCYNQKTGKIVYDLSSAMCDGAEMKGSITALRFRPSSGTRNLLLVASQDGISKWHLASQRMQSSIREEGNLIYALDYNLDGTSFCSAGKDCVIRVYDEEKNTLITKLAHNRSDELNAHTNRIQSVKWSTEDPNLVVSGGWDLTVQLWDLREGVAVRSIFGPYICGDGIDCLDKTILCGSTRDKDNVEIYDIGSGQKIQSLAWPEFKNPETDDVKTCQVFQACYGNKSSNIVAACGTQDLKIFDRRTDRIIGGEGNIGITKPLYACHVNRSDTQIAFGGAGGSIFTFELQRAI